ncbi:glutamate-5-semialdehyde dehydrogenase [Gracilibacillus sp. Marseille-QA3620]
MSEVREKGKIAKEASFALLNATTKEKNEALRLIADKLLSEKDYLIQENIRDLQAGKEVGLTESVLDRIMLNEKRIEDMSAAIQLLIEMKDPIGEVLETIKKENGLFIQKKAVPIGVIGMIYEARPNVTVDAATLALKTGNAVVLRGSSSAQYSNQALVKVIHKALSQSAITPLSIQLIEDTSRETAKELFTMNEYLDVLIPRGGKKLIETVVRESTVPVLETGAGNCHLFIDRTASFEMASRIAINAKTQRPSVCNAIESILIEKEWFSIHGEALLKELHEHGVTIYGDEKVCQAFHPAKQAGEEDWETEYLGLEISIKTVSDVKEAINHINRYGTKHSEAIISEDKQNAEIFMNLVDAAAVYHNASTRFTDGFEFGYGAEIGISTQKLHARGPMGLKALTSSKFYLYGEGQIRV